MTWLYLSLGAALSFASLNILSRVMSVDSKNPRALSLVYNLVSVLISLIIFFLTNSLRNFSLPTQAEAWIYFLIAAFFYGLFERLRFYATRALDASTFSIIGNLSIVIAFFISLFLYKESLTLTKLAGFISIMISLFLVVERKKSKIKLKAIVLGLFVSICLGIGWGLDKKGVLFFNPITYNLLVWFGPLIFIYFPHMKLNDMKVEIKKFSWKIILLSFLNVIGYLLMLKAFNLADATRIIPITQLSTLMTVIVGIFLLNEKNNLFKKLLAGIIAVFGVFLLR